MECEQMLPTPQAVIELRLERRRRLGQQLLQVVDRQRLIVCCHAVRLHFPQDVLAILRAKIAHQIRGAS